MQMGRIPLNRTKLPDGVAGVDQTVRTMFRIGMGPHGAKSPRIRALAIDIVRKAGVREKDYYGEASALYNWVRDNIRYLRDPIDQETLLQPEHMVFAENGNPAPMAGDCDDQVVLLMALLGSVGMESYPVVVGTDPKMFSHVYLHAIIPQGNHRMAGQIVPMDPIMPWPVGKEAGPPHIKLKKTYAHFKGYGMGHLGNQRDFLPGLGAYATGPSYLDTEHSQAAELLAEGSRGGTAQRIAVPGNSTSQDGTLTTTARVRPDSADADGMFLGEPIMANSPLLTGTHVTAQEDRYGRIRNYAPGLVPSDRTGPLGPLTEFGAERTTKMLPSVSYQDVPTEAGMLRQQRRGSARPTVSLGAADFPMTKRTKRMLRQPLTPKPASRDRLWSWRRVTPHNTLLYQGAINSVVPYGNADYKQASPNPQNMQRFPGRPTNNLRRRAWDYGDRRGFGALGTASSNTLLAVAAIGLGALFIFGRNK